MRLNQMPDADLQKTFKYICNLCGYPEVSHDKLPVLISFLKDNHGNNTDDDLIRAFTALAAGRLDEKQESFKNLTGLSASRVLSAYIRQIRTKNTVNQIDEDKSPANDETIRLVKEFSGRVIRHNHEVTHDEHRMLMDHWIGVQRENFKSHKRVDLLTSTAFDYLEKNGSLRIKDGSFQMWDGRTYIDICPWQHVQDIGERTKKHEDYQRLNANQEFRKMGTLSAGESLDKVTKRVAVSLYFEHVI